MKKTWKKIVVALFAFALAITGVSEVYAAEETEETAKYYVTKYSGSQVKGFKDAKQTPIMTSSSDGKYEGLVFAGWFKEDDCETALGKEINEDGEYYAKFVPAEVLSVKAQVKEGTTSESEKTDLRLVATVDSLRYKSVGFEVYYDGATTPIKIKTTTVYNRIEAAGDGVEYGFSPNIFDSQSEYFVTATLTNIANKNYGKSFYIRPYVETLDGTISYGVSRYARVEDSYLNIVNVPVRLASENVTATEGSVNVSDFSDYFSYVDAYDTSIFDSITVDGTTTPGTVTITGTSANECKVAGEIAHLRFQVEDTLKKNNVFKTTPVNLSENVVAMDTVYKHFAISPSYSGTPDTSWYDANQKEFVITSAEELYGLEKLANANKYDSTKTAVQFSDCTIYLGTDIVINEEKIDPTASDWSTVSAGLEKWYAIGQRNSTSAHVGFKGIFDGQGHTISGVYANSSSKSGHGGAAWYNALFGCIDGGTVRNLKLVNSYFGGQYHTGAVASFLVNGTIGNVYVDATVASSAYHAGGIVSTMSGGTIRNSWFEGKASTANGSNGYVAGILGFSSGGKIVIEDCLNAGEISGSMCVGGIVGRVATNTDVENCFSTGAVTGKTAASTGAAIGQIYAENTNILLKIGNVHAYGSINGIGGKTVKSGGTGVITIKNSNDESIEIANAAETFTDKSIYYGYDAIANASGFDYESTWVVRQSDTPVLNNWCESGALYVAKTDWTGAGTEKSPYVITTPEQLYGLAQTVNAGETYEGKYFKLGADIRINTGNSANWETTAPKYNWIPIGSSTAVTFKGHFNATGSVREVKGLYVNTPTTNHGGLFGSVTNGSVKNIKVTNSYIKGASFVAAISGFTNAATIENVYTNATVVGASTAGTVQVAGIVGYQVKGTVRNAWFDGAVTGVNSSQYVGGVVGRTTDSNGAVIDNCLATGTVTSGRTSGNAYVGGILGGATRNTTVSNCFVALKSPITTAGATACVGSVVGGSGTANYTLTVKDCYAASGVASKTHGTEGVGKITVTATVLTAYTGGNAYLNTYLEFDRHEDALPEIYHQDGVWVAREGKVPGLKSFVAKDDRMELVGQNMYRADTRWYNSSKTEFTISTMEELVGLASIVDGGNKLDNVTINLGADIIANNGNATDWAEGKNTSDLYPWESIGEYLGHTNYTKTFYGDFDGKGHTISGLYTNEICGSATTYDDRWGVGLFAKVGEGATIKDFKLLNSYMQGSYRMGAIVGQELGATIDSVYTDAILKCHQMGGGIVGLTAGTVNNCWFDGQISGANYVGGITSYNGEGTTISNCLNTGGVKATSQEAGGIIGRVAGNISIQNCLSEGTVTGTESGSVVGEINSGTVTASNVYATTSANAKIAGKGTVASGAEIVSDLTGANGYLNTWLTFDRPELPTPTTGKWVAIDGGTPVLKSFVEYADGERLALTGQNMYRVDTRWYNADETEFTITTAEQLLGFANLVNSGNTFADKTVTLGADITINNWDVKDCNNTEITSNLYSWPVIGAYGWHTEFSRSFAGTFDGASHTVKGLYTNRTGLKNPSATDLNSVNNWCASLFGRISEGSIVKNVSVTNSYFEGGYYVAGVVGDAYMGDVQNVYSDAIIKATGGNSGGIVGRLVDGTIENAWFDGSVTNAGQFVGGIAGVASVSASTPNIENCLVTGKVISTKTSNHASLGGILGETQGNISIKYCLVDAEELSVKNQYSVGSVIGCVGANKTVTSSALYVISGSCSDLITSTVGAHKTNTAGTVSTAPVVCANLNNYKGYMNTALDFDNTWVAMEESAPRLQIFAPEEGRFDTTSWFTKAVADENENAVGTEANPYIIDSLADLYGFTKRVKDGNTFEGQYIKLTQSITANDVEKEGAAASWATEAPYYVWSPIGGNPNAFKGNFDGGMNTISGLYATGSYGTTKPAWYTGLFGYVNGATIKNVRVEDSYFYAEYYTAGVVGYVVDGTVDSVYSNATTEAKTGNAAVVVGAIANGTIQNSWADGCATTKNYAGGITSFATTGTITIQHCLNTGDVTATAAEAGGIVGRGATEELIIDDCLSLGLIETPSRRGTIVSYLTLTPTITSCYGYSSNGAGAGGTATKLNSLEEIYDAEAYERLNAGYWAARVGNYPVPAVFATGADYATAATKNAYYVGDTTFATDESGAYLISSAAELYGLASLSQSNSFEGTTFKLTNDITINHQTLNKNTTEGTSYEWLPIGSESVPFKGTFNGQGYTISGLYKAFNNSHDTKRWTGLFDTIEGGVVENLNIENTYFTYVYNGKNADPSRIGSVAGYGGGTFRNIRSTASLVNDGRGTGGIIGQTITDTTISNCWFDGKAICETTTQSSYLGGLIGFATIGGNVVIEHSHVSGDVLGGSYHVGGLVGNIQGAVQATITDSMFNGDLKASFSRKGDVYQHGQLVGTVVANAASDTAGKGPSLTVTNCYGVNDFASYDIGAAYVDKSESYKPSVTGSGNVSVKADRLIGYAGNTAGLDYTNYWTLTKNGTPQLATFTSASDRYDGSQLTSLFKLDTVGKTLANAEDVGAGRYTVKLTGKALEDYNAYCEALDAGRFDAWGNDQSSDLNAEGVYNKVFTNADKWVVNVSFMEKTSVITITVSSVDTLSKHLKASSITAYTAEDGYTTSGLTPTFSMVEQKYAEPASSYVIQLANGHFIVIDGGINNEAPYLMEYLESLVPAGKKPIIEAWVISHAHMDHMDVFRGFYSNLAKYQGKLYIEGIYFSEANDRIMSTVNAGEEDGHHHYLAYFKQVGSMFKTTTGAEPQVYRMYTGQRFTFDTVVMDIMLANEQFTWNDYVRAGNVDNPSVFNETSTWTMFTINGKKLLTAGDSNYIGKEFVVDNYSTDYLTVDIFTALHHGENINREQPSYSMKNDDFSKAITVKGAVLYSYPTDWYKETSKTTVKARIKEFMELQQDRGMTGFATTYESGSVSTDVKGYFYHGQGTVVLTFGDSITANVKAKNDWVNSYIE